MSHPTPSQAGLEFLWKQESDPVYRAITWPGGQSGVTVGGFYDLGQQSALAIQTDWSALPEATINRLMSYAGTSGAAAKRLADNAQDIDVPLAVAREVFDNIVVARFSSMTDAAFPNCHLLPGDCFGALVSLVFNRGSGMIDPPNQPGQRLEMREIRTAMAAENFDLVAGFILAMQRLWPVGSDLWRRREQEAAMFTTGLHPSLVSTTTTSENCNG